MTEIQRAMRDVRAHFEARERGEDAPCEYGHFDCSCTGSDNGPCFDEACSFLEANGVDPDDALD